MRHSTTTVAIASLIAFATGLAAAANATHFVSDANVPKRMHPTTAVPT